MKPIYSKHCHTKLQCMYVYMYNQICCLSVNNGNDKKFLSLSLSLCESFFFSMHGLSSNDIIVQLRFSQCTFSHLLMIDVGIICEVLKVSFIDTVRMSIDMIERECRLHLNRKIFFSCIFITRKINIFITDAFLSRHSDARRIVEIAAPCF